MSTTEESREPEEIEPDEGLKDEAPAEEPVEDEEPEPDKSSTVDEEPEPAPAAPAPAPTAIATRELAPPPRAPATVERQADPEMDRLARLGAWLAASEVQNPTPSQLGAAAALRIYLAGELGLPITAASELSFIKGRLNVGAHLQRYLAYQAGLLVVKADSSDEACTAILVDRHTGEELGRTTFTIEQARRRGSVREGGGYTRNPDRMLWARATTEVLKDYAPHVQFTLGVVDEYDAREMADAAA